MRVVEVDRNGLQILERSECLRLLDGATLGRVGVTSRALPVVLPVNFLLDDARILIRTGRGTKMAAALDDAVVAFEVDDFDPLSHSGWSVLVTGVATVLEDPIELELIEHYPLPHWATTATDHVVAISTDLVSGRRLDRSAIRHAPDDRGPHGRSR